jgi:hypothetical protein
MKTAISFSTALDLLRQKILLTAETSNSTPAYRRGMESVAKCLNTDYLGEDIDKAVILARQEWEDTSIDDDFTAGVDMSWCLIQASLTVWSEEN